MGYMRHHAIVVTSWDEQKLLEAHTRARVLNTAYAGLGRIVSEMTPIAMNGQASFVVAPDGSKEGWDVSDQGDDFREEFVTWLREQSFDDGSSVLSWVLVQFGDDNDDNRVLSSDADNFARRGR